MTDCKTVWIIGAGAIGSVLAALLNDRTDVRLVGAGPHARAVAENGLAVETPDGPWANLMLVVCDPADLPRLDRGDLVLLAGKAVDMARTAERLKPCLGPKAEVIALYNGLGPGRAMGRLLDRELGRGVAFFGANSPEPGRVIFFGGRLVCRRSPAAQALADLLADSGLAMELTDNFDSLQWRKLAVNCLANPLAGLLRAANSDLISPDLDRVKELILDEVKAVARACGQKVDLTPDQFNKGVRPGNTPSLRTDLLRGRSTEIDYINGAIVRLAKEKGLNAPTNELIVGLIHFLERRED